MGSSWDWKNQDSCYVTLLLLKLKCRTLICAPTNIAVLEVAARLLGLVNHSLGCGKYGLGDIILFGNGERMKIDNYDDLVEEKYLLYSKEIRERRCDEDGKDSNNLLTTMKRVVNDSNSTKDDEDDFLTLEEFVKEKLCSIGKDLKICMENLYTHLPTSCISLEVVKAMIRAWICSVLLKLYCRMSVLIMKGHN
ncbi:putative ATP-dependent helicase C29A10.10c [Prunus yedoensis var. nudiflora]|uniref:Putative ATP-dependent helicase C29A10.10c n=1 Tax=Prunus yedoensis var. nudiflora TaxID=2094558 RepID=A0A314XR63_PRUYE|nr:putative ATP-dependent helicase C29A10.10c [Prunus yedoensis var. nudiflora]